MSGHYKLNPPPYVAGPVRFFGVPDEYGAIFTDEAMQAYIVIRQFGAQGPSQQKYVNAYFRGASGVAGAPAVHQLTDIGEHFTMSPTQEQAIGHGCANVRPEFLAGTKIAFGLDAANQPTPAAAAVGGCQSTTVSVARVGSLYSAICDSFQHNLNVGWDG